MMTIISKLELAITLPEGAHPLEMYDRYYAKGRGGTGKVVSAVYRYRPDNRGGIHIVAHDDVPQIFDGGCNIINVRYLVESRRFEYVQCNGEA